MACHITAAGNKNEPTTSNAQRRPSAIQHRQPNYQSLLYLPIFVKAFKMHAGFSARANASYAKTLDEADNARAPLYGEMGPEHPVIWQCRLQAKVGTDYFRRHLLTVNSSLHYQAMIAARDAS